jgi:hypothetical protein
LYLTASVIFLHNEGNSVVCLENIFYYYQWLLHSHLVSD